MKINMKPFIVFTVAVIFLLTSSCHSTKKFQNAINRKDTTTILINSIPEKNDSLNELQKVKTDIVNNYIDFNTFSAKIKLQYEDSKGKQPDVNVFLRMQKDSIIWLSINATFLNFEAFRVMINKDSIFIMNKLDKKYSTHPLTYLEQMAHIPLDLKTLQNIIIGNPVFLSENIVSFKKTENRILISTIDKIFKNLLTLSASTHLIERSKLDDVEPAMNRTADLSYAGYEPYEDKSFATYRELTIAEKTKVDIILNFKQYEFNKELSFPFSVPKNFRKK